MTTPTDLLEEDIDSESDWSEVLGDLGNGVLPFSIQTAFTPRLAIITGCRPTGTCLLLVKEKMC